MPCGGFLQQPAALHRSSSLRPGREQPWARGTDPAAAPAPRPGCNTARGINRETHPPSGPQTTCSWVLSSLVSSAMLWHFPVTLLHHLGSPSLALLPQSPFQEELHGCHIPPCGSRSPVLAAEGTFALAALLSNLPKTARGEAQEGTLASKPPVRPSDMDRCHPRPAGPLPTRGQTPRQPNKPGPIQHADTGWLPSPSTDVLCPNMFLETEKRVCSLDLFTCTLKRAAVPGKMRSP